MMRKAGSSKRRTLVSRISTILAKSASGRVSRSILSTRRRRSIRAIQQGNVGWDVRANQVDIPLRPIELDALLDVASEPLPNVRDDETQIVSTPAAPLRARDQGAGRRDRPVCRCETRCATDQAADQGAPLQRRPRRQRWRTVCCTGTAARCESVLFTRLVRLSYLAPDITQAILDGRQPRDLTADKLLAHSRLPLGWPEQRAVLGFA